METKKNNPGVEYFTNVKIIDNDIIENPLPKYDFNDTVYHIFNNKIQEFKISSIIQAFRTNETFHYIYDLFNDNHNIDGINEKYIFISRQDLINSL